LIGGGGAKGPAATKIRIAAYQYGVARATLYYRYSIEDS
jgi:hypothetical protein